MPVLPRIPMQVPRKINAKHTQERTGMHRKRTQKNNSRARVVLSEILPAGQGIWRENVVESIGCTAKTLYLQGLRGFHQ